MEEGSDTSVQTIPLVEERAEIEKRRETYQTVHAETVVREREVSLDEPFTVETIDVERVPVTRWVDAPVPVRDENGTTVISLHEEIVVVEKRLRVVEEIRLTKRQETRSLKQTVSLRREEAVIEQRPGTGEIPAQR